MSEILLPIFPLPNVVFFPKIFLPLHIFEPRYKQMIEDALQGERQVGMILLQEGWQTDYFGSPPVHRVGCLGKIETFEKLPQGRFNILLHGLSRFEILKFVTEKPYRQAQVKLLEDSPFVLELQDQLKARDALLERFVTYLTDVLGMEMQEGRMDRTAPLETIVNQVAAVLDIPVQRKQDLLEIMTMENRLAEVKSIVDDSLQYAEKLRRVVQQMRFAPENPEVN
jgi:Lon protease-like protein